MYRTCRTMAQCFCQGCGIPVAKSKWLICASTPLPCCLHVLCRAYLAGVGAPHLCFYSRQSVLAIPPSLFEMCAVTDVPVLDACNGPAHSRGRPPRDVYTGTGTIKHQTVPCSQYRYTAWYGRAALLYFATPAPQTITRLRSTPHKCAQPKLSTHSRLHSIQCSSSTCNCTHLASLKPVRTTQFVRPQAIQLCIASSAGRQ